jgi:hypothetical protein
VFQDGQLRPGDRVAVVSSLAWALWIPQAFQVAWTELEVFTPPHHRLPAGATVVEAPWPDGQDARAGWPQAPAGWRIVASDQAAGWVVWRRG